MRGMSLNLILGEKKLKTGLTQKNGTIMKD